MPEGPPASGLLASARGFASTLLEAMRTRLELFAVDAQEAGERVVALVIWTLAGLFCLFMGLVLVTLLVIVAFWENSPLLAVGLLAAVFLAGAVLCALSARALLRARPGFFAATIETLQGDRDALAQQARAAAASTPAPGSPDRSPGP